MTATVVILHPDMQILTASHLLVQNKISGAPVMDNQGNLVGMLTERDCFRTTLTAGYYEELGGLVADYMSRDVKTVDPDMSVIDLAQLFLKVPYRRFPVMRNNRLIGLISRRDVLRALLSLC